MRHGNGLTKSKQINLLWLLTDRRVFRLINICCYFTTYKTVHTLGILPLFIRVHSHVPSKEFCNNNLLILLFLITPLMIINKTATNAHEIFLLRFRQLANFVLFRNFQLTNKIKCLLVHLNNRPRLQTNRFAILKYLMFYNEIL